MRSLVPNVHSAALAFTMAGVKVIQRADVCGDMNRSFDVQLRRCKQGDVRAVFLRHEKLNLGTTKDHLSNRRAGFQGVSTAKQNTHCAMLSAHIEVERQETKIVHKHSNGHHDHFG